MCAGEDDQQINYSWLNLEPICDRLYVIEPICDRLSGFGK